MWDYLLQVTCPKSVRGDWHKTVMGIVSSRVSKLPPEGRVDLFCELETQAPEILANIFMTEADAALDQLIFKVSVCAYMHVYACIIIIPTQLILCFFSHLAIITQEAPIISIGL